MDIEIKLLEHQRKFLESNKPRVLLLGGRASGKSYIASIAAAINLLQGKRIIVLAQTFAALQRNIFAEITARLDEWKVEYHYNSTGMVIKIGKGICYGYSYENIEALRGLTNISVCIADEIALAPNPDVLFAALSPVMRGQDIKPKMFAMTTPRGGSAWNELFKNDKSWDIVTATTFDNTFLSKESIKNMEDSLSEDMKRQELYGDLLDMKVENAIIDVDSIVCEPNGSDDTFYCGIDFARYGNDETVILVRNSYTIVEICSMKDADTEEIVSRYLELYSKYKPTLTAIDATGGYDIGFYDRLKNSHKEIVEVNFGGAAPDTICLNNRAYIYSRLAEALKNGFCIGVDSNGQEIRRALKYTTWTLTSNGKRQLIPKAKIKEIIGRSPDTTDALALSFYKDLEVKYVMDRNKARNTINFLFR